MRPFTRFKLLVLQCCLFFALSNRHVLAELLNPPYFNLAEGRNITATSTCGENVPEKELYCKLVGSNWLDTTENVNLIEGQACDYCDPLDPKRSHPASNAIDGTERWWQSPPLSRGLKYSEVGLTIDLGQEFHVAYVFIKMGNSPRPGVWVLERSRDHGKTFTPWQYFADTPVDCIQNFGQLSLQPISKDDSVICETKFSKLVPLEGGEIAISLLNGRPSADNFSISATLQDWSTATNIRLKFIRPKTTLGHYLAVAREVPTVTRRYFYSIKDINIGGRCVCNGHASQCDQASPTDYKVSCSCQHNTCGTQCESCCPGYNQYAWSRATLDNPFFCEKCNCNGHSEDCYFDPEVAAKNGSVNIFGKNLGGGVCVNCQHNTTGINCDKCKDGFYRPANKPIDAIDVCQACQCDLRFSTGSCYEGTGICQCKNNFQEPDCAECSYGFYSFPECKECECYRNGTVGDICELKTGQCPCEEGYGGLFCKKCSENFFGFPSCQRCECDLSHSIDNNCNITSGQCNCKTNYGGRKCDQCSVGYYNYPSCQFCQCDRVGSTEQICDPVSGTCFCKPGYYGSVCDQCAEGYYGYPNCVKCDCNLEGSSNQICDKYGKCKCKFNYSGLKCSDCSPGYFNFPKCIPCNCNWRGAIGQSCDHSGNCICGDRFEGQKCDKCKEGYYNFPVCEECNCNPAGLVAEFGGCDKMEEGKLCECKSQVKGRICNQCKDLHWNLQMQNVNGCEKCLCNQNGTISRIGLCDNASGQCMCKRNVQGRTCDTCKRNTYLLESGNLFGCVDCNCDVGGSIGTECNRYTGQCLCKPRITGLKCSETHEGTYFPTLYQFLYEAEDWFNPTGSQARFGYDEELFPNYSWRGYAAFNNLQKEIFTNISISKFSIYRVIVNYVNRNSEPVNAVLKFTPNEWLNEEEQLVSIVFEPSKEPKRLLVTGKLLATKTLTLVVGPWHVSLKADKPDLYVDYVVLLPQVYYDQNLFQDKRTEPCSLFSDSSTTCVKYSYPVFPADHSTIAAVKAYSLDGDVVLEPELNDQHNAKLNIDSPLVKLGNSNKNLNFDLQVKESGSYLVVLNYHTLTNRNRSIELDISLLNSEKNISVNGRNTLTACSYSFVCRQIFATEEGEIVLLDLAKDEKYNLKLTPTSDNLTELDLNVHSVTVVPFGPKWSFDYVKPKLECILKGGTCAHLNFPPTTESLKIEAESEANRDRATEEPSYSHTSEVNIGQKPVLVRLDGSNQAIDLRGTVPEPGSYSIVLHYYQPRNASFETEALIQDGHFYSGTAVVDHCPNIAGCRVSLRQRDTNSSFFFIQKNFMITLRTPSDSEMFLDYVLVIPGNSFKEQQLSLISTDVATNLMGSCIQDNYYIDPDSANDYCRSSIFSITVDLNSGASPCQCNIDGSYDHKCKSFGGQCNCKPNVIGRECSMCRTGYYGFPNCRKCNCPSTAICHTKTGDCICPKGVTGENCDKCLPLTFGFDRLIGCVDCSCSPHGVQNRDLNCDLETGNCNCKRNIVGRTCDKCKAGFFSFPECQLCRCDIRGTIEDICDQRTARCFCKKNVDGIQCDKCKTDSYYLEESNQLGCTKCFCFGTTDRCTSSPNVFTQVRTNSKEWDLFNVTVSEEMIDVHMLRKNDDYGIDYTDGKIVVTTNVLSEGLRKGPEFDSSVYMALAKDYLGNKITSYGGVLQYKVINKINNKEDYHNVVSPDLILIGPNISIIHQHYEQPVINEDYFLSIRLLEKEFKHLDGRPVTREQLMMTLVRLEAIYVRIKYFDPIHEIVIQDLQMDITYPGSRISASRKALSVEQCTCPRNYKGTSCEECAEGYYRVKKGSYLGTCEPCNCNGHSNECDPVTGKCFNCKYNTEGDQCERCIEGYHGDATRGTPHDCIICACPLPITSNNFATSCEVSPSGSVLNCNCKQGYNGTRCDYCAAGHFGHPEIAGGVCSKCECNNNIDVTDPFSCDSSTGICVKCLNNASGDRCERCAPWYYGDSVTSKNCTGCSCDQCGSEYCDHFNGDCKCKSNVIGKLCDKCAPGHYGFSTCEGCKACKCAEGAVGHDCDETGQCSCKPGVSGKNCETCLAGYWGYSRYGCTSCKCNEKFSRATQCNLFTGQCQCLPGVVGEKCERCPDRWVLVPENGCQECGNCVHVLLNDTDELYSLVEPIQNDIQVTSSSVLAFRKLNYYKQKNDNYTSQFNGTFADTPDRKKLLDNFGQVKKELDELSENMQKLDFKTDFTEKNLNKTNLRALSVHNDSLNLETNVKQVKQFIAQVVENMPTLEQSNLSNSTMQNLDQKSQEADIIINELRNASLKAYEASLRIDLFNETLENAASFVRPSVKLKEDIEGISNNLYNLTGLVLELKNLTQKARESTINAERIFKGKLKELIQDKIATISDSVGQTESLSKEANKFNNESKQGFELLDNMKVDIEQQRNKLQTDMDRLKENMDEMSKSIPESIRENEQAKEHAANLRGQSSYLNELFASTKNLATDPLRAANAYNNISAAVSQSESAIKEVKDKLLPPDDLTDAALVQQVTQTSQSLAATEDKLKQLLDRHGQQNELVSQLDSNSLARISSFDSLKGKLDNIEITETDANIENIKSLVGNVKTTESKVRNLLDNIGSFQIQAKNTINSSDQFFNEVREAEDFIKRLKTHNTTESPPYLAPGDVENKQSNFKRQQDSFVDKINELRKRIQIAKHHANNIRVGAKFEQDSVLELNKPSNLAESSTYTKLSLQFLTRTPNGLLTYIGNPSSESGSKKKRDYIEEGNQSAKPRISDYMCLEIRNGKVTLTWDLGSKTPNVIVDEQNVYDNNWHQVTVEQFGKLVRLQVKTKETITEKESRSQGSASVFTMDPKVSRIFIGGISPKVDVGKDIENRNFVGTISNVIFDNEPLGLWNLKQSTKVSGSAAHEFNTENSLRFNGNSYVIMPKAEKANFREQFSVSFYFKTFAKNGLLLLVGDPKVNEYLAIEISQGNVVLRYELGSAPTAVVSQNVYNDGKWHMIKVNRDEKESVLTIDDSDEQNGFSLGLSTDLSTDDNIYIGGFPGHPYFDVTKHGFEGCIKELQILDELQNLNNNKESYGVALGCSTDFVRIVSFAEQVNQEPNSYIAMAIKNETLSKDNLQISFKFRTLSKLGLLLHLSNPDSSLYFSIYLTGGLLALRSSRDETIRTDNHYFNDNQWHYLTVMISHDDSFKLDIDDVSSFETVIADRINFTTLSHLYVGGLSPALRKSLDAGVYGDFIGCVGDITLNEDYMNFAESSDKHNAQFTKCPLAGTDIEEPSPGPLRPTTTTTVRPPVSQLPPIGNCKLPPITIEENDNLNLEEVRFGDTLWSRYEFSISNDVSKGLENESAFQVRFKTVQASGIVFYITSNNNIDFVGLYFVNNRLHYGFDCGSGRGVVALQSNYSDGQWHSATFGRKGKTGYLRVGEESVEMSSAGATSSLNVKSPIYVGGVPEELSSQVKGHLKSVDKNDYNYAVSSFSGCLSDLKVRKDLEYKFKDGRPVDVSSCSNQVENGHFFHYNGGHIRLFEEFRVRVQFTLIIQVKPRKPDGILAAVFGKSDFLVLYLDKGKVVFSVDNGASPIVASKDMGSLLCDGNWHTITAVKSKNLVTLAIDDAEAAFGMGSAGISSTDTKDPFYIGGLPNKLKEEKKSLLNSVTDNYLGCLRIKELNGFTPTLNNVKIEGHITLNSCPVS